MHINPNNRGGGKTRWVNMVIAGVTLMALACAALVVVLVVR